MPLFVLPLIQTTSHLNCFEAMDDFVAWDHQPGLLLAAVRTIQEFTVNHVTPGRKASADRKWIGQQLGRPNARGTWHAAPCSDRVMCTVTGLGEPFQVQAWPRSTERRKILRLICIKIILERIDRLAVPRFMALCFRRDQSIYSAPMTSWFRTHTDRAGAMNYRPKPAIFELIMANSEVPAKCNKGYKWHEEWVTQTVSEDGCFRVTSNFPHGAMLQYAKGH